MKNFKVPEGFVPRDFQMDPATDDLIRSRELKEGMVVVIEDHTTREDPETHLGPNHDECDKYKCIRVLESARWCKVTNLQYRRDDELVSFIGVYHDGTKRSRTYNKAFCWFVKQGSLPLV